jgi:hypothetical protein
MALAAVVVEVKHPLLSGDLTTRSTADELGGGVVHLLGCADRR